MYSLWDVLCMCVRDECGMTLCKDRGTLHAGRTNIRYFINSSNHIHNSCSSLSDSLGFIHRAVDDETNMSFFLILIDSIRVCPWSLIFLYLFFFFFFSFCNSDSRSGSEVVLRLLVPGGSGDWSLCTGRRRSRSSGHNAGSQERPRQKDGATGGGTAAAPGTSSPHLAHHGAAEQSAAAGKCNSEPGSGQST